MEGDSSEDDTCPYQNRLQDHYVYAAHLRIRDGTGAPFCVCVVLEPDG